MVSGRASIALALLFSALAVGCMQARTSFLEKQARYLQEHPKLDDSIRDAVLHREVLIGMTQEQVFVSLGEPSYRSMDTGGTEHWFYQAERIRGNSLRMLKDRDMMVRLSFKSGILKTIGEGL